MAKKWIVAVSCALVVLIISGWFMLQKKDEPVTYQNPVFEPVVADPSVIKGKDGFFYAYGTEDDWGDAHGPRLVPILKSKDLTKWEYVRDAFDEKPSWKEDGGGIWAPDISLHSNGTYYLYYSISLWGDANPGIGVATADKPEGPFRDHGVLFRSDVIGVDNSIDPKFFQDDDGNAYLLWGSFRGIYGIQLTPDGLGTVGEKFQVAGNMYEAPYLVKRNGSYYLFLSSGTCCDGENSGYYVTVGRSDSIKGPYLNKSGEDLMVSMGYPVVLGSDAEKNPKARFVGPGHNAIIQDDQGTDWIVYHAVDLKEPNLANGATRRPLMIDPLIWEDGWPQVKGFEPSSEEQDGPYWE